MITTRLAAIDIGTNSTKMTLADVDAAGSVQVLAEDMDITRLGEGVDKSGSLSAAAMSRTLETLTRFAKQARDGGAVRLLAAGTSALRDASNGADFLAQAQEKAGVAIEIIAGEREAELAYKAVRSDSGLHLPPNGALLVFDIGGGSTELVLGDANGVGRHRSLQMGAVRVTERFLHSDPPTQAEQEEAVRFIDTAFAAFPAPDGPPLMVAGIGGTAVNIAAVTRGLNAPDSDTVNGATLTLADVDNALRRFAGVPLAERKRIPGLEPKRADVIGGGALVLSRLLRHFQADQCVVSARGLRYGLLAEAAQSAHPPQ